MPERPDTQHGTGTVPQRRRIKNKRDLFFCCGDGRQTLNSKAARTAAATVCQQNLHRRSPLVSATLSSNPRSLDLRTLMAYHIASSGLSRSDAPQRRDQSAATLHPATLMEERALPCSVLLGCHCQLNSQGVRNEAQEDALPQPRSTLGCCCQRGLRQEQFHTSDCRHGGAHLLLNVA